MKTKSFLQFKHHALCDNSCLLLDNPTLKDKILAILQKEYTMDVVKVLIERSEDIYQLDKTDPDKIEYTMINMEEDGELVYNQQTERYVVNSERKTNEG